MNWYREWDVSELGAGAHLKPLAQKCWDDDTPPFLATYRTMRVLKVHSGGALWCEYTDYDDNGKTKKQKVLLEGTVVEIIPTRKNNVSRVYIRQDGKDIGFLWPESGNMGKTWIPHYLVKNGSVAIFGPMSMSNARNELRAYYEKTKK